MTTLFENIPSAEDPFALALWLQTQAATVNFDWKTAQPILAKLHEEIAEFETELNAPEVDASRLSEELGDILFTCINLARRCGLDSKQALLKTNQKFIRRFQWMEQQAENLSSLSLDAMEALWQNAKEQENNDDGSF